MEMQMAFNDVKDQVYNSSTNGFIVLQVGTINQSLGFAF